MHDQREERSEGEMGEAGSDQRDKLKAKAFGLGKATAGDGDRRILLLHFFTIPSSWQASGPCGCLMQAGPLTGICPAAGGESAN